MRSLLLPSLAVLVIAAGCGGQKGVVGRWKAKEAIPPATSEIGKKLEEAILKTVVEFRGDGTMFTEAMIGKVEGTYKVEGSQIVVTAKDPLGMGTTSTINFELSADGKTLTRKAKNSDDKLIFERI